jgi:glutamate-1-semialdehyde 2,1-aminomutase
VIRLSKSESLFKEALEVFSGGVNSPVRAAVRPYPFFVEKAKGSHIFTVDGKELIDYVLGYGPLILGHAHDYVLKAVKEQIRKGWLYGAPTVVELELAKRILSHVMPKGKIRFVNSGSEATMTAIRLARGYTGKKYIIKFDGCYHGSHDGVLVSAGSAASEYGVPTSLGVPDEVARLTLVARYNDIESVEELLKKHKEEVAAVIVEPVIGNMGVIPPKEGFLKALRELCNQYDTLLIFDEVITGFRLALGGAQEYYNVKADIVVLGKIIGGGFPIGAVVSSKEIMSSLTPEGKVFNAGTFNAHPVSMAAGLATLEVLEKSDALKKASRVAEEISRALDDIANDLRIDHWINRVESMFQIFFTNEPVLTPEAARKSDRELYARFHEELLKRGVFIAPSQFEAIFTSGSHTKEDVEKTVEAIKEALAAVKQ